MPFTPMCPENNPEISCHDAQLAATATATGLLPGQGGLKLASNQNLPVSGSRAFYGKSGLTANAQQQLAQAWPQNLPLCW